MAMTCPGGVTKRVGAPPWDRTRALERTMNAAIATNVAVRIRCWFIPTSTPDPTSAGSKRTRPPDRIARRVQKGTGLRSHCPPGSEGPGPGLLCAGGRDANHADTVFDG